jgi:hypothetical protein
MTTIVEKLLLTGLLFCGFIELNYAQARVDSVNIYEAEKVITQYIPRSLKGLDYIVYSLNNNYCIVTKLPHDFVILFISKKNEIEKTETINMQNDTLKDAFNPAIYKKKFVYSTTDSLYLAAHHHSKYIYFLVNSLGHKKIEFNFPALKTIQHLINLLIPLA